MLDATLPHTQDSPNLLTPDEARNGLAARLRIGNSDRRHNRFDTPRAGEGGGEPLRPKAKAAHG